MKYSTSDIKPSDMFINSLSGGGSHFMTCGNCGRDHYCPDSMSIDDSEEYEDYLKYALSAKVKNPDSVLIHYDVDFVAAKNLHGIAFVLECPCNGLSKYEEFIWNNKEEIEAYLKVRTAQEIQWAQEQLSVNKLKGV